MASLADAGRHEGRLGDADEGFLHEQRDGRDRTEARLLESAVDRRLVGPDRGDDALLATVAGAASRVRAAMTPSAKSARSTTSTSGRARTFR